MIDIENEVFSRIATVLREQFSGVFVTSEYTPTPAAFPAVSFVQMDNSAYQQALDSAEIEKYTVLMFQVDCYSNLSSNRKSQCKAIMAIIDEQMYNLGFVRISSGPIDMPNAETSIYRMTARYRAVVNNQNYIFRG